MTSLFTEAPSSVACAAWILRRGAVSGVLACLIAVAAAASAQEQSRLTVELQSQEDLPQSQGSARALVIREGERTLRARIIQSRGKRQLSVADRPIIDLPYPLTTLVSDDGRRIVQYGDELDSAHPSRTNVFWIGSSGDLVASVTDRYAEEALVSMSSDGWTAVAGRLREQRDERVVDLYGPTGERAWEQALAIDQRASHLAVARNGTRTFLATTNPTRRLEDHRLHVFNERGEIESSIGDFGIIQKIVVVNEGKHVFVQGYDDYGLVEAASGSLVWRNRGKIRMVSPHAARTDATGDVLFLVLADFTGRPKPTYRWNLVALDASDGRSLRSVSLPEEYPGTWDHVFEEISGDRVTLLVGARRFTFGWQRVE